MYQRRQSRVLLAALVLLALILITVDFRSGGDGALARARGLVGALFSPVQEGLASLVRPVDSTLGGMGELLRLRSENERLRDELEDVRRAQRARSELERENRELRQLLGMAQQRELRGIVARTVALGPSNYEWTVTLDVGSDDGVERDMVVVEGAGLVGRVIQVGASSSRVLLAIDPNFGGAAHVARLGEQGRITGRGSDLMRFIPLDPEAPVEVGDEIVTSAYQHGIFPNGVPIGSVEDVIDRAGLLTREVLVRPFVDFTRLSTVLVIEHAPVAELPPVTDAPPDVQLPGLSGTPSPRPSPGAADGPSPGAADGPSPGAADGSSPAPSASPSP